MKRPATHPHSTLIYYLHGSARVEQRGAWRLGSGDVMLVPAGEPHSMLEARTPEVWGLTFGPADLGEASARLLAPFERVRDGGAAVVSIPRPRQAFLSLLFEELAAACPPDPQARVSSVNVRAREAQQSLLTLVLDEVVRAQRPELVAGAPSLVGACLRVIERRCLGSLTLTELADEVGRTPSHLTTALRRATGRTAHQWIVAGRMAEARRRLRSSDELVDVIAERVGYADPTAFIRMFRREHGATPAAWRKQQVASAVG